MHEKEVRIGRKRGELSSRLHWVEQSRAEQERDANLVKADGYIDESEGVIVS